MFLRVDWYVFHVSTTKTHGDIDENERFPKIVFVVSLLIDVKNAVSTSELICGSGKRFLPRISYNKNCREDFCE